MKLIKAYASWCQPCKALSKLLIDIDHPLVAKMTELDIDEQMETAMKYKIRGVPTMIITDDSGKEMRRMVGLVNKEKLISFLDGV